MEKKRVVAIIQARMGSTRLSGKVLRSLAGKPMLEQQLERVRGAKSIDAFVVATTEKSEDDPIVDIAKRAGMSCFRGDEKDVLDRYYRVAKETGADVVVRITGDCPLHDPRVIDLVVKRFEDGQVDYTITPANFPEGLDTEVFSFTALEAAWKEARLPSEREHVTPFICNHPDRFVIDKPWTIGNNDHSSLHWSVDTEQDFAFAEKIYQELRGSERMFHMEDVLKLLSSKPALIAINKGSTGYEGYQKSLKEDEEFLKSL